MTAEKDIEQYKSLLADFNTADFGEYSAETFESVKTYGAPAFYPGASHPRILFTENSIDRLRADIHAEESHFAYEKYIELSDSPFDGKFPTRTEDMRHNYSSTDVSSIEAKAFRYAMTGDKIYGYKAIYAAKNAILTIDVPRTFPDWCRTYGFLMYVVGCTYDWCYDLLTEDDKAQLIAGCVNRLGMMLEIVCYGGPENKIPSDQGAAYGHGAEDQILVDYLSFAIACYNEAPEIYGVVAGRILNEYPQMQNYLFAGGNHWEGSMYGGVRTSATIISNILFNKMTDGRELPFKNLEEVSKTFVFYNRPDGQPFRIGDVDENYKKLYISTTSIVCFYAGNLYKSSYLKSYAYEIHSGFRYFKYGVAGLTPVQFLATNDPSVPHTYEGHMPLTRTTGYPSTSLFVKSAFGDKDAFALYMTMPENFVSSHAHMECGSFQIFYKGILASDSGAYARWGGEHHMGYNMSTVSSNSILIYNPAFKDYINPKRKNMVYSGGQSIDNGARLPRTIDELLVHPALGQCTSLGKANVEAGGAYRYSYLGGDMTKAYDKETASEVCRYIFAVATENKEYPLALMTFDRITSLDATFHKSALVHMQEEPIITDDGFAVITNTKRDYHGKLILQTVGFDTEYTLIGGEEKEYWIAGVDENGNYSLEAGYNIPSGKVLVEDSVAEYGWGRIEISPAEPALTNRMLTVMYVTDAENSAAPIRADDICSESLAGAEIFGKAILFPKDEKLLTEESSFTLTKPADCYVAGVFGGSWSILCNGILTETVTVEDGTNLITFSAKVAGIYTLKPAK